MLPQHVHGGRVGQWTCMSRVHGWFDTLGFDESLDNARVWGRLDPVFQVAPCEDDSGARAGVREIGSLKEGCTKQEPSVSHRVSRQRPCWCVCASPSALPQSGRPRLETGWHPGMPSQKQPATSSSWCSSEPPHLSSWCATTWLGHLTLAACRVR